MIEIPFASFKEKYAGGEATIVGKGPTLFDYELLAAMPGPVCFINDAVLLTKHLDKQQHGFLFFLDQHQAEHWLGAEFDVTMVVKEEHRQLAARQDNRCVFYQHCEGTFPVATRSELARSPRLFLNKGTITPILHFLWYTGVRKINLIGCDGLNRPTAIREMTGGKDYDPRIPEFLPGKCRWINNQIRASQDALIELFGFAAEYHGTPTMPSALPVRYVSCATPDYAPLLARLKQSAEKFGLDFYSEFYTDTGDWVRNTCYKAEFIHRLQTVWPDDRLCWVDADAVFEQQPAAIESYADAVDVAHAFRGEEVLSGTVYFGATEGAKRLVKVWLAEIRKHDYTVPDAKALAAALKHDGFHREALPPEYTFIFDITKREHPGLTPVILHTQASRWKRR